MNSPLRISFTAKKRRKKEYMNLRVRKNLRNRFMTVRFATSVSRTKRLGKSITRLKSMKRQRSFLRLVQR